MMCAESWDGVGYREWPMRSNVYSRHTGESACAPGFLTGFLPCAQIQMRDLPGFMETRQMLLKIKPGNRTNWISFAIAHHLNGSHDLAVQMLDTFETNIMGVRPWQYCVTASWQLHHGHADATDVQG